MTNDTTFVGVKGGVGTSTIAALYALEVARSGQPVRLTATDAIGVEDLAAILGVPALAPGQVVEAAPRLSLADRRDPEGTNVLDAGTLGDGGLRDEDRIIVGVEADALRRGLALDGHL